MPRKSKALVLDSWAALATHRRLNCR